jgi:hypothetical protein
MTGTIIRLVAGLVLAAAVMSPPIAGQLEASMVGHLVVQIPLLATAGWFVGRAVAATPIAAPSSVVQSVNGGGIPGLMLAAFAALFWMLPRSLDAALLYPAAEAAKFASVPLLVGLPLSLSWQRLAVLARAFVWANLVSMLAVLGWLYLVSPVRLCNSYLVSQQERLGSVLLTIAVGVGAYWIGHLFVLGGTAPGES